MAVELHKGILLAHHLGRRTGAGRLRPEQVGFGKPDNVREVLTCEGTVETHQLVRGKALTGLDAFR